MKFLKDRPYNDFDEDNPDTEFWTDGKNVYNHLSKLRGANPGALMYSGIFAKDDRKCFCGESWIKDADVNSFRVLNYTFAIDKNYVFTITGKVKDADVDTFKVLDDGKSLLWYNRIGIPEYTFCGYAKDKNNVYYHNYEGKPKVVKKADLETFVSLNDGYFAKDKNNVYGNGKIIKKANPQHWVKMSELNTLYSKDNDRVFYGFWELPHIDYDTFELEISPNSKEIKNQLAKDKTNFYKNGEIITAEEFNKLKESI